MGGNRGLTAVSEMITAYAELLPLLPLIAAAAEAERKAPGYGAKAVAYDYLTGLVDDASRA